MTVVLRQKFSEDHNDKLDVDEESKPEVKRSHVKAVASNGRGGRVHILRAPKNANVEESTDSYKKAMWKGKVTYWLPSVFVRYKTERPADTGPY